MKAEKVLTTIIIAGIVVGVVVYYKEQIEGTAKAIKAGADEFINNLR